MLYLRLTHTIESLLQTGDHFRSLSFEQREQAKAERQSPFQAHPRPHLSSLLHMLAIGREQLHQLCPRQSRQSPVFRQGLATQQVVVLLFAQQRIVFRLELRPHRLVFKALRHRL